ncbi:zinc-binding dehydrogenase [Streptomyces sp. NPDC050625]|uniref:zinc-dependent alcohol dehydrogenase n=1 Tax=Streptomyces sp. NPDC050625 TaxID=3154629 RepID=UPI00344332BF
MTTKTARSLVLTGPRSVEIREVSLPRIGPDDGLLEIESNGLCGSDVEFYDGSLPGYPNPMTLGHEPVGRIAEVGAAAAERWGLSVGDRVVVNSALRCGHCASCTAGGYCRGRSYGTISPNVMPGLWGGMASHLYLDPASDLLRLNPEVTAAAAAFHNPLANGFEWAVRAAGATAGVDVVILGAGPRGIGCAIAAASVGARVTLVGLERDRNRLELVRKMGIDRGIAVSGGGYVHELRDHLGREVDTVVDTTPHSVQATAKGIAALRTDGRLVLAGIKGPGKSIPVDADTISMRRLSIIGPIPKTRESLQRSVDLINSGYPALDLLTTESFALDQLAEAIAQVLSDDVERPIHVRIEP